MENMSTNIMKKLKIGVVDTGIDTNDCNVYGKYKNIKELQLIHNDIYDEQGHGTFVFKSIYNFLKSYNRYIEIYPIKIFDAKYFTSLESLLEVLDRISRTDLNIINLSCSYESLDIQELKASIDKLTKKGKLVLMSDNNNYSEFNKVTELDNVIGVKGEWYIKNDSMIIVGKKIKANGNLYLYKYNNKYDFFGKNSRACAITTANISKLIINKKIKFDYLDKYEIFNELKYEQKNNFNQEIHNIDSVYNSEEVLNKIIEVINLFSKNNITVEFIKKYGIRNNITKIGMHNFTEFIEMIERRFKMSILYEGISFENISTIYGIEKIIIEKIYKEK